MRKICLLFGILFFLCGFAFAETFPELEKNGRKVHAVAISARGKADFTSYEQELTRKIFSKWKCNINDEGLFAAIDLKLNKDGTFLEEPEIFWSSKNYEFDKTALEAVKSIKYFNPLPDKVFFPYVKFRIDFQNPGWLKSKYNANEVDFAPYMRDLQRNIKANWQPKNFNSSKSTTVMFKISKDGTLSDLKVYKSSGDSEIDEAGMEAVRKTKIHPLPEEFKGKEIEILFTLDIHFYDDYNRNKYSSSPQKIGPVQTIYYENLGKNLVILKTDFMRLSNGYKYINALKFYPLMQDAYLYRCKIDCKNKQIGINKIYAGSSSLSYDVLGFSRFVNIYTDEVKMNSFDKNDDYEKIYNYVCEP